MADLLRERRPVLVLRRGLRAAAQIERQELLGGREEAQVVLRTNEPVPLVGEDDVLDGLVVLPHGLNDLVALGLLDARIVRPLPDEQRRLDAIRLEQRRSRAQKFLLLLDMTDALVEDGSHRSPIGRDGVERRRQARRSWRAGAGISALAI